MKELILIVALLLFGSTAHAFTVINLNKWSLEDGGNDHWYAVMTQDQTWNEGDDLWLEAYQNALTLTVDNMHGYLATITSQSENDFILNSIITGVAGPNLGGVPQFFLGGKWEGGDIWSWITGESFTYNNWNPGVISPGKTYNPYISIYGTPGTLARTPGKWNDVREFQYWSVVEFNAEMNPIPEPATVALLGIGLVGLAGAEVRRRRKKAAVNKCKS